MPFLSILVKQENDSYQTDVSVKSTNPKHCQSRKESAPRGMKTPINSYIRRALAYCSTSKLAHEETELSTQVLTNNRFKEGDVTRYTKIMGPVGQPY